MWVQSLGLEDPWRRKWQPTPVFLPGETHGQGILEGQSPQGGKELDTTEATQQAGQAMGSHGRFLSRGEIISALSQRNFPLLCGLKGDKGCGWSRSNPGQEPLGQMAGLQTDFPPREGVLMREGWPEKAFLWLIHAEPLPSLGPRLGSRARTYGSGAYIMISPTQERANVAGRSKTTSLVPEEGAKSFSLALIQGCRQSQHLSPLSYKHYPSI